MKGLMVSTLALTLAAGTAFAESHTSEESSGNMENENSTASMNEMSMDSADLIRTRDITGGNVYAIDADADLDNINWSTDQSYDSVNSDWDNVGSIEDIVLNSSGQMVGIVAEVGGFLGIGDKHVLIQVDNVSLVPVDDATYSIVTPYTRTELDELEGVDEGFWN